MVTILGMGDCDPPGRIGWGGETLFGGGGLLIRGNGRCGWGGGGIGTPYTGQG